MNIARLAIISVDPASSLAIKRLYAVLNPLLLEHLVTGGALAFIGDIVAQYLQSKPNEKACPPRNWDVIRTYAYVTFGALYTGGAQHFIFEYLDESFDDPLDRLALAQFFFIPFCYYPTLLLMVPLLRAGWEAEGGFGSEEASVKQRELSYEVAGRIPWTLFWNWIFWIPIQYVQFKFMPVDLQVAYVAAFGVVWNSILSWSTAPAHDTPVTAKQETKLTEEAVYITLAQ